MRPKLGQQVRYTEPEGEIGAERVAFISGVFAGTLECDVHILNNSRDDPAWPVQAIYRAPYSEKAQPGCWHYPEAE